MIIDLFYYPYVISTMFTYTLNYDVMYLDKYKYCVNHNNPHGELSQCKRKRAVSTMEEK